MKEEEREKVFRGMESELRSETVNYMSRPSAVEIAEIESKLNWSRVQMNMVRADAAVAGTELDAIIAEWDQKKDEADILAKKKGPEFDKIKWKAAVEEVGLQKEKLVKAKQVAKMKQSIADAVSIKLAVEEQQAKLATAQNDEEKKISMAELSLKEAEAEVAEAEALTNTNPNPNPNWRWLKLKL